MVPLKAEGCDISNKNRWVDLSPSLRKREPHSIYAMKAALKRAWWYAQVLNE